jgi:hypothetical protein
MHGVEDNAKHAVPLQCVHHAEGDTHLLKTQMSQSIRQQKQLEQMPIIVLYKSACIVWDDVIQHAVSNTHDLMTAPKPTGARHSRNQQSK